MSGIAASNIDLASARKSAAFVADAVEQSSPTGQFQQTLAEALQTTRVDARESKSAALRSAGAPRLAVGKELPQVTGADAQAGRVARDQAANGRHASRTESTARSAKLEDANRAQRPERPPQKNESTPQGNESTPQGRADKRQSAAGNVSGRGSANLGVTRGADGDAKPVAPSGNSTPTAAASALADADAVASAGDDQHGAIAEPIEADPASDSSVVASAPIDADLGAIRPTSQGVTLFAAAVGPADASLDDHAARATDPMSSEQTVTAEADDTARSSGKLSPTDQFDDAQQPTGDVFATVVALQALTAADADPANGIATATSLDAATGLNLRQRLAAGLAQVGPPDGAIAAAAQSTPTAGAANGIATARSDGSATVPLAGTDAASVGSEAAKLFAATLTSAQDASDGGQPISTTSHSTAADQKLPTVGRMSAISELFAQLDPDSGPAEITQRVVWMNQQGLQFARIHLHPSELGPIEINLDQRDGGLTVSMTAHHPLTRDLLESHLPRMREQISSDGTRIDRFDISDGRSGGDEQRAGQGGRESPRQSRNDAELSEGKPIRLQLNGSGLFEAYA